MPLVCRQGPHTSCGSLLRREGVLPAAFLTWRADEETESDGCEVRTASRLLCALALGIQGGERWALAWAPGRDTQAVAPPSSFLLKTPSALRSGGGSGDQGFLELSLFGP